MIASMICMIPLLIHCLKCSHRQSVVSCSLVMVFMSIKEDQVDDLTVAGVRSRGVEAPATFSRTLAKAVISRKSAYVYQEGDDGLDQAMSMVSMDIRSAMMVPLMVQNMILGLMIIDTSDTTRGFREREIWSSRLRLAAKLLLR